VRAIDATVATTIRIMVAIGTRTLTSIAILSHTLRATGIGNIVLRPATKDGESTTTIVITIATSGDTALAKIGPLDGQAFSGKTAGFPTGPITIATKRDNSRELGFLDSKCTAPSGS
jgi:hypothetical protein